MIKYFVSHKTAANLIMLFFIVIGLFSINKLQKETLPTAELKHVQVQVKYPGANVAKVEESICQKVEDSIENVANIQEVSCEAKEGISITKIEIVEGENWQNFVDDIRSEIDSIDDFPSDVEDVQVTELNKVSDVISVVLYGDTPFLNLKDYANHIKDEMQTLKGLSLIEIEGSSDHQFRVEVSQNNLNRYHLNIDDISNSIQAQNIDIPSGELKSKQEEFLVKFENETRDIEDLKNLIVLNSVNSEIKLSDVATISEVFELHEEKILYNGKRALLLKVKKTRSEDIVKIATIVKEYVNNKKTPSSIELTYLNDMSEITIDRLRLLVVNGLQGLVLVFLALWLFFRIRFAFWVAMGLPVSFLGGLWLMSIFGVSLNMLSMVGLLMAIGILMDDAIVISENIMTELSKGKKPLQASIDGLKKVANGVISSFITTCAVFIPLALLEGEIGQILRVIPIVLILVLSVSLIEAFIILPNHLKHTLESFDSEKKSKFRKKFNDSFEYVRENIIGRAVDLVIDYRYLFAGAVVGIFIIAISVLSSGMVKFQAFPDTEGDIAEARILMPQGTPLNRTEDIIENILKEARGISSKYEEQYDEALIKSETVYFNKNLDYSENGPHIATISLELLTSTKRSVSIKDFLNEWNEKVGLITGAISISIKESGLPVGGAPLDLRLYMENLDELNNASLELSKWLKRYEGVTYINSDLREGKREYVVSLKDGALALGINGKLLASKLQNAFQGSTTSEIQIGKELVEIDIRLKNRESLNDLEAFRINNIPLTEIATITEKVGYSRINRVDGKRVATVKGEIDTRVANANEILANTKKNFIPAFEKKYPELNITYDGQSKEAQKTGASFLSNFAIGLFAIYILLSIQFSSYVEPIIVMVAIPLAFIGVVFGHFFMGINLAMPSILGFVSLAGIVVNDSILLVLFLKWRVNDRKQTVESAAKEAPRDRFRAIFLTSITTIFGLIPLLLETSFQAQILIPLVVSTIFGLLASTVLVLFAIPVFYTILNDVKMIFNR